MSDSQLITVLLFKIAVPFMKLINRFFEKSYRGFIVAIISDFPRDHNRD